jgi:hypothetical protein
MLKQLDVLIGFAVVMSVVSLLITIITQMISAALGLRGLNLADSLIVLIKTVEPNIPAKLRSDLVHDILTRPIISDSMMSMSEKWWDKLPLLLWLRRRWKIATAIRADELLAILRQIAGTRAPAPWVPPQVQPQPSPQVLVQPQGPQPTAPVPPPQTLEDAAAALLGRLNVPDGAMATAITALNVSLPSLVQAQGAAVLREAVDAANVSLINLEKWFNSAQDRAQQWFAIHTRLWTVIAAVVMAFLLQLDAFKLLTQLSDDSELRSRLVSYSSTIKDQAESVFTNTMSLAAIHQESLKQLESSEGLKIGEPPDNLDTTAKAEQWLTNGLATTNLATDKLLNKFRQLVQDKSREKFNQAREQFANVTDAFAKSGFQLIPDPYPKSGNWSWPFLHLLGILASAALLSLGAPFWFNMLKSFTNLRPMLSSEVDKNPKQLPATATGTG